MSLVNDMLKDLDQRRSDSNNGSGRVKLTPASEFPQKIAKLNPVYVLGVLILAVVVLGFTWLQSSSGPNSRTFDSSPQNASPFEVAQPTTVSEDNEPAGVAVVEVAQDTFVPSEPESPMEASSPSSILSRVVQQRAANSPEPELYQIPKEVEQANDVAGVELTDSERPNPEEFFDMTSGAGIDESVINEATISEDQQDTMAVQRSLRLIADNKVPEAYANFNDYIAENRYAHQSRETYAKLLINDGELQAADALIEQGLGLSPNNLGFKKVKARILIRSGKLVDAVEVLVSKAPPVTEDVEYHEILASAQLASKDFAGAAISYSELVGADQSQGKYWYGYAAAQELLGNTNVARQAYARAVQQGSLSTNLRRRSQDRLLALRE
ncbi:MAG: Flp pilus assembly protein TadD [Pseudohongiellaceae bacterium]|jgi:Flp pilus assembly protein TadD